MDGWFRFWCFDIYIYELYIVHRTKAHTRCATVSVRVICLVCILIAWKAIISLNCDGWHFIYCE